MFNEWDKLSKKDFKKIANIVKRASRESPHTFDPTDLNMDLGACHVMCPLDLDKLLAAPKFDFAHDVAGISKHIDRDTGELTGFFLPRCASPQS